MTTAADVLTAISAITTVIADLIPQANSATNTASASNLRGGITAANISLLYMNDLKALTVGF